MAEKREAGRFGQLPETLSHRISEAVRQASFRVRTPTAAERDRAARAERQRQVQERIVRRAR